MTHTRHRPLRWFAVAASALVVVACRPPTEAGRGPSAATSVRAPPGGPTTSTAVATNAVITHVVDGDTVDVRVDGRRERVRLIGINTPNRG